MVFERLMLVVEIWKGDATSRYAGIISVVVGLVPLRSRAKHWPDSVSYPRDGNCRNLWT